MHTNLSAKIGGAVAWLGLLGLWSATARAQVFPPVTSFMRVTSGGNTVDWAPGEPLPISASNFTDDGGVTRATASGAVAIYDSFVSFQSGASFGGSNGVTASFSNAYVHIDVIEPTWVTFNLLVEYNHLADAERVLPASKVLDLTVEGRVANYDDFSFATTPPRIFYEDSTTFGTGGGTVTQGDLRTRVDVLITPGSPWLAWDLSVRSISYSQSSPAYTSTDTQGTVFWWIDAPEDAVIGARSFGLGYGAPIPEPATAAVWLGAMALGVAGLRRRHGAR